MRLTNVRDIWPLSIKRQPTDIYRSRLPEKFSEIWNIEEYVAALRSLFEMRPGGYLSAMIGCQFDN
jgi:hypothetical protein